MSAGGTIAYDFAVLRAVPHVHLGAFVPVGVVLNDWNPVLPSERRAYQSYEGYEPTQ